MDVAPLVKWRPRPVALCYPAHRRLTVLTSDGSRTHTGKRAVVAALERLTGHVCYVPAGLTALKHTTGASSWTCATWRGRGTRMVHEGTGATFTSLRGALESAGSPEKAWDDMTCVLGWLRGYGVAPGTISGMAWALWRAALPRTLRLSFDPEIGRSALFGGRQEVREPRTYQHMVAADISAAYPVAMASRPYGLSLRSVSPESDLDASVAGLARARVWVPPDLPYAPLPVRLAPSVISFQRGPIEGCWSWCELAAARELGCEVKISAAWAPRAEVDLFSSWWSMAATGRTLPTEGARELAKALTNSLWGQFAMSGEDRAVTRWEDDRGEHPYEVALEPRTLPHRWTAHVAAETTARVRTRLLIEGLYAPGRGWPVHVDTDGIIVRRNHPLPSPAGDGPGHWRRKAYMRRVDVRAPQLYRYLCDDWCGTTHPKWHYVAAGVTPGSAPEVFEREGHPVTPIGYRGVFDTCVPSTDSRDTAAIARHLRDAAVVGGGW